MTDPFRIFPPPTARERSLLRASIKAVGLQDPPVMDEFGNLIDGHERRAIAEELGIEWMKNVDVRIGMTDIEKKALAIDLNMWRRPIHLTRKKRNELLDIYLIANPHLSGPQVAEMFGVDPTTANRHKEKLVRLHKLERVTKTIGKDGKVRSIGNRKKEPGRIVVKNKAEYEKLQQPMQELGPEIKGFIRRPQRIINKAERKRNLANVNSAQPATLPEDLRIECCDFRDLVIAEKSVNVILTDVVWQLKAERDWRDLANCARRWLRPDGILCSLIGNEGLFLFMAAMSEHLTYKLTIDIRFSSTFANLGRDIVHGWTPAVVFSKAPTTDRIQGFKDFIDAPPSKDKRFHNWQQSLPVAMELMKRLTRPGDTICDAQMGTGTNAVACSLLGGGRTFIGCDIDPQQVRTTRHRLATEGRAEGEETPDDGQ